MMRGLTEGLAVLRDSRLGARQESPPGAALYGPQSASSPTAR